VKVVIKLGGTLLDGPESLRALARQLAQISSRHQTVVVHGGGKQVTRFLEERGIQSRFKNGLRVSDAAVIDAVTQVIAGGINKQLVSAVTAAGRSAVGLSGVDGLLTRAAPWDTDLQFVGKPVETDPKLLDLLIGANYLPVIACLAADGEGNIYNVNADEMAVSCAVGWQASKLLFITDVPGVKDENGKVLSQLSSESMKQMIESGVARGGMQAKLQAAETALQAGLEVLIASGAEPDICARLLAGERLGTRLGREETATGACSR
jgi:acetylglutamate kinase